MAKNNKTTIDQDFEDMKNLAIEQQQCFYELLCDCMIYLPEEHKYLRQNIGYACFGPPTDENTKTSEKTTESNVSCSKENQNENADVTDTVCYNKKSKVVIDKIYDKICEYTIGTNQDKPIYFAIIYNMVLCPKSKKAKEKDDKSNTVILIPIFKIWKSTEKKTDITKKKEEEEEKLIKTDEEYEVWYVDTCGRIYKDWTDYKTKNNLFKCTMVLPKDGLYQPDPSCPITEDYSTVWLEIMESPACSLASQICDGVDIASTVTGTAGLAVGIASLFTPLAPVVAISGAVATGTTAIWAMARSSHQLVDRSVHEESINPLSPEAFPQWLTITGSAFGLGAMGGAAAISTAVSRGMTVNTAARIAFNAVQGGNLFLNGVGIIYQSYCMVDKYMTDATISYLDAVSLATHLMFFAGTVVKIQFAGDIIESNQNRILDEYRESLRSKRFRNQRYKLNRIKKRAAVNNSNAMSENAEVIRYINDRNQLISNTSNAPAATQRRQPTAQSGTSDLDNTRSIIIKWTIKNGILMVNGIMLLDPIEFVAGLIRTGMSDNYNQNNTPNSEDDDFRVTQLLSILDTLLAQYIKMTGRSKCGNPMNTSEFVPLLREMDSLNIDDNLLEKLFNIAIKLIQRSRSPEQFLLKTMRFIWLYCKSNLKQWGINTCLRMQSFAGAKILRMIITAIFEAEGLDNLYRAFEDYLAAFFTAAS